MRWSLLMPLTLGAVAGLAFGLPAMPLAATEADVKVALWLEVVHRVCTSVGGLGTFVALIFVVRQFNLLRTQTQLVQKNVAASRDGQLYSRLDSFNKFVVEHYREYELLDKPYERDEPPDDRAKLHDLCDLGFTYYREIYKHHVRYRLLETEDWEEWQQNMAHFFSKPYVRGYWKTVAGRYARSFQAWANDLVATMEPRS
jgi:hypothetical protein